MVEETKADLSEKLNGLLGLESEVNFTKLSKKDLVRVLAVIGSLPALVQVSSRAAIERVFEGPFVKAGQELASLPILQRWREIRKRGGLPGIFETIVSGRKEKPADEDKTSD